IGICNVGEKELTELKVELVGFGFKDDSGAKGADQVFDLTGEEFELPPGECMDLELKAKPTEAQDAHVPGPEPHAGWLAAWGPKAGMIRLGVTVSGPGDDKVALKKSAVGEEIAVTVPFENVVRFELPLVASADKTLAPPEVNQHIGRVYSGHSGGRLGRIYVDGAPRDHKDKEVLLPVRVEGLKAPGEYKGTVNLSGDDDEAIRLTLTLEKTAKSAVGEEIAITVPFASVVRFKLPLVASADKAKLAPPPKVDQRIGVVYSGHGAGRLGRIYVDADPPDPKDGVLLLPVRVEGLEVAGEYKGTVNLLGDDDDAIKLTLTLEETAKPVVSEISRRGTRNPLSGAVHFQDGIIIQFHRTNEGELPALIEVDEWVGVVSGEHQELDVERVACEPPEPEGSNPQSVCLDIPELDRPGEFTGKVDVTDNDSEDDKVTLTVSVADGLGWAIGASATGVLLAAVVLWLTQGLRPWLGLWNRFGRLEERINSESQGCRISPGHPYRLTVDSEHIREALGKPNRLIWDTASNEYKALVGMLDDVKKAKDLFCKKSGDRYQELQKQLGTFLAFCEKGSLSKYLQFPPNDPPQPNIAKVVALQISPPDDKREIDTGKVQTRLDLWEGLVKLMKKWVAMALAIYRYEKWIENLRNEELAGRSLLGEDRAEVARVEQGLREAAHELYEAASGEELADKLTEEDLGEFYDRLAKLSSKYDAKKVWVDPQTEKDLEKDYRKIEAAWPRVSPAERIRALADEALETLDLADLLEEAPAHALRRARIVLDLGLLLFALAVAVFTGLQANYFDKTFGMCADYAKMILLGGGAQTLVAGLVTIVDRVFRKQ
ncbi:MAG: hypothetical protein PVG71_12250, partial [Anaerolineae bacterium]